ncbi:unnamed protein product [Alopecurus aequalis]
MSRSVVLVMYTNGLSTDVSPVSSNDEKEISVQVEHADDIETEIVDEDESKPAMGQRQSLEKYTSRDENDRIMYAASSMQGFCSYRVESRQIFLDLDDISSTSFFGVYDGHGGARVANHCASKFHTELQKDEDYRNNLDDAVGRVFFRMDAQLEETDQSRALANPPRFSFFKLLRRVKTAASAKRIGSTACVAVIRGNRIIVGNVGHSRCILSRGRQAMDLSIDHKPNLPGERQRIENAGGRVTEPFRFAGRIQFGSYRVNGILAMSRAIGYFHFKSNPELDATEQIVTCNPDVRTEVITADTEFLLIASDGIWKMLSSQRAVDFVHEKLDSIPTESIELSHLCDICEKLLNYCAKSKDNSTVILVQFKPAAMIAPPAPVVQVQAPMVQDQALVVQDQAMTFR